MPPGPRVAIYWVPALEDPLWEAGNRWLGYNPELGCRVPQPCPEMDDLTAAPRLYGFHATLRPPMHLATDWPCFVGVVEQLAATTPPFALPALAVANLGGFLALRETAPCPALHALADACVGATNAHRLPPDDAERARRRAAGLTAAEEVLMARWGYPYVMESWRFHLTLSRRLTPAEMATWHPRAQTHFAASVRLHRQVSEVAIFTQLSPGLPFRVSERFSLSAQP